MSEPCEYCGDKLGEHDFESIASCVRNLDKRNQIPAEEKENVLYSFDKELENTVCCIEVSDVGQELLMISFHYQSYGDFWGEHRVPMSPIELRELAAGLIAAADAFENPENLLP